MAFLFYGIKMQCTTKNMKVLFPEFVEEEFKKWIKLAQAEYREDYDDEFTPEIRQQYVQEMIDAFDFLDFDDDDDDRDISETFKKLGLTFQGNHVILDLFRNRSIFIIFKDQYKSFDPIRHGGSITIDQNLIDKWINTHNDIDLTLFEEAIVGIHCVVDSDGGCESSPFIISDVLYEHRYGITS